MTFATFVGLELHKRYLTTCALAADGTLLGEVRRMPATMDALLDVLTALPAPATVAVEVPLSPMLKGQVERLLRLHDFLTAEIRRLDDQVKRAARGDSRAKQRQTIPGVGVFGSVFLLAEIGPIERFRSSHELAAYAGLVPTKGRPKATTAAARKFCCYLFWMLTEGWSDEEWLQQHVDGRRSGVRPSQRMGAAA